MKKQRCPNILPEFSSIGMVGSRNESKQGNVFIESFKKMRVYLPRNTDIRIFNLRWIGK